MKRSLFSFNRRKKSIALLTFLISSFFLQFTSSLIYAQDILPETASSDSSEFSDAFQAKSVQTLSYLQKIKDLTIDFDVSVQHFTSVQKRLVQLHAYVTHMLDQKFRFEDISNSIPAAQVKEATGSPTIQHFVNQLENEVAYSELQVLKRQEMARLFYFLQTKDWSGILRQLEEKQEAEIRLIKSLSDNINDQSEALLAELYFEALLTQFWMTYAGQAQTLRLQLEDYLKQDFTSIESKALHERDALKWLHQIYPGEEALSSDLDPLLQSLFSLYSERDIDLKIKELNQLTLDSAFIFSFIESPGFENTFDLSFLQKLNKLEENLNTADFKSSTDEVLMSLKEKNQFESISFFENHYRTLHYFAQILTAASPSVYEAHQAEISRLLPFVQNAQNILKDRAKALSAPPLEAPDAPLQEPSESQEKSAGESADSEATESIPEKENEPASDSPDEPLTDDEPSLAEEVIPDSSESSEVITPDEDQADEPETQAEPSAEIIQTEELVQEKEGELTDTAAPAQKNSSENVESGTSPADTDASGKSNDKPAKFAESESLETTNRDSEPTSDSSVNSTESIPPTEEETALSNDDHSVGSLGGTVNENQPANLPVNEAIQTESNTESDKAMKSEVKTEDEPISSVQVSDPVQEQDKTESPVNPPASQEKADAIVADLPAEEVSEPVIQNEAESGVMNESEDKVQEKEGVLNIPADKTSVPTMPSESSDISQVQVTAPDKSVDLLSESETMDVVDFLEGDEAALDRGAFIQELIKSHPAFLNLESVIQSFSDKLMLTTLTQEALIESMTTPKQFNVFYQSHELTADQWDLWLNFMNQLIVSLSETKAVPVIRKAALRFDPELCGLTPPVYDFSLAGRERFDSLQRFLSGTKINQDQRDFCLTTSSDITTKNIAGRPDFTKQITDSYSIVRKAVSLQFSNNVTQKVGVSLTPQRLASPYHFFIDYKAFSLFTEKVTENSIENEEEDPESSEEKIEQEIADHEPEKESEEEISPLPQAELPDEISVSKGYIMSALENQNQLFNGLIQEDAEQLVVYESKAADHQVIHRHVSRAKGLQPESLATYYLYNEPPENESEIIYFDGVTLKKEGEFIKGYINNTDLPVFVIGSIGAAGQDNQPISSFNYQVDPSDPHRLQFDFNADAEKYPLMAYVSLDFIAPGENPYDLALPTPDLYGSVSRVTQAAGDINGDGLDDLVRAFYGEKGEDGSVEFYYAPFQNNPQFTLKKEREAYFGHEIYLHDLNQDDRLDLIVSNPFSDQSRGVIYIYYGTGNGYLSAPDLTISGAGLGHEFGAAIEITDFDQDGLPDVVAGAPGADANQGAIYFFSSSYLTPDVPEKKAVNADKILTNESSDTLRFGERVYIGDLNHDQFKDVLVASLVNSEETKGRLQAYYQKDSFCIENCHSTLADLTFEGPGLFGLFAKINDFNADGKNDLMVASQHPSLRAEGANAGLYFFYQDDEPWTRLDEPCLSVCSSQHADSFIEIPSSEWIQNLKSVVHENRFGFLLSTYSFTDSRFRLYRLISKAEFPYFESSVHQPYLIGRLFNQLSADWVTGDFNQDQKIDLSFTSFGPRDFYSYLFYGQSREEVSLEDNVLDGLNEQEEEKEEKEEETDKSVPEEEIKTEETESESEADPSSSANETISPPTEETNSSSGISESVVVIDSTVPAQPVVHCTGAESGVFTTQDSFACSWTDTTDSAPAQFYYCMDSSNTCEPSIQSEDRHVTLIGLTEHHHYLRVYNQDEGGKSKVAVFTFAMDNPPELISGPSDGSSSLTVPTAEEGMVLFSATAHDEDNDDYYLLTCRTSDRPVYDASGRPVCPGGESNLYCRSGLTTSEQKAVCNYSAANEKGLSAIWYAFICSGYRENPVCSSAYQGEGVEGSPFYIQRTPRFESLEIIDSSGGAIEPGDRLAFKISASELKNVNKGSAVSVFICSDSATEIDLSSGECVNGELICNVSAPYSEDANYRCEASDSYRVPLATRASKKEVSVFVNVEGDKWAEGENKVTYSVADVPTELTFYDHDGDIDLQPGGTFEVKFSATLKDQNGWDDLIRAEGVFFNAAQADQNCIASQQNCYIDEQCQIEKITDTDLAVDCSVDIFYNASAGDKWKVHVKPIFNQGRFADLAASKDARQVPEIMAINQEEISIPYPVTLPGSISETVEVWISNLGNQPVDLMIDGTSLQGNVYEIPRGAQKWSLDPNFDFYASGYELTESAIVGGAAQGCVNLNLPVDHDISKVKGRSIYWKIAIPEKQKSDLYEGVVRFKPAQENTCQ